MPNSFFILFWCLVMLALQIYTATYMPYSICFNDIVLSGGSLVFEYFLDFLFAFDVLINFISAKPMPDGTLETNLKVLGKMYVKGRPFIIDVLSALPSQLLE